MEFDVPFMSITEAARVTGLSVWYLRHGIADGTVPYVRVGRKAMVNVPRLLKVLDEESKRGVNT